MMFNRRIFRLKVESPEFKNRIISSINLCRYHLIEPCSIIVGDMMITIDDDCQTSISSTIPDCNIHDIDIESVIIVGLKEVINSYFKSGFRMVS